MKKLRPASQICGAIFDIDGKKTALKDLQAKTVAAGFWDDNESAQAVVQEINKKEQWVKAWESRAAIAEEIELLDALQEEDPSEDLEPEIEKQISKLESGLDNLELKKMLGGKLDDRNAILTIHPGAGGTESQDWAEMLMRMYLRYAEKEGFKTEILDFQSGDEAGIKSVTIELSGDFAYGYLKAEAGVHRLVRISPFDANSRRHTSFASLFVLPEIDDKIDIDINPVDLKIDTYRASGAGGQHVNKTDSAIRITHIPSGIVVQCQNERSQHKNKANAMKILAARLYKKKEEEQREAMQKYQDEKKDIAWGSQIRSYVFHPYNMVKDHRTGFETSNIQQVMDGDLYGFIKEYLVKFSN